MKKKEYMAPTTETVHIEAKHTFLQYSDPEPQPRSVSFAGDDEGWGEGE